MPKGRCWCDFSMNAGQNLLVQQQLLLQDKRRYFLLGASGTAVAFTVTQIGPDTANAYLWVLCLAVLCFGLSLIAGLLTISFTNRLLETNYKYLDFAHQGLLQNIPVQVSKEIAERESFDPLNKRLRLYIMLQIGFVGAGATLLPIWKILSCQPCLAALGIATN